MKGVKLAVTGHDNRGDDQMPYGFVYFNDDRRICYSKLTGVTDGTGGWDPIGLGHFLLARQYLVDEGVLKASEA